MKLMLVLLTLFTASCGFIWSSFETNSSAYISNSDFHTCARSATGALRCWGEGLNGKLGYNNTNNVGDGVGLSVMAAGNISVGGTIAQIATGTSHTCVLFSTGQIRCWGSGASGLLGYNNTNEVGSGVTSILTAGDVPVGGSNVTQISTGAVHNCVLFSTGNVRCWGFGGFGKLGYGSTNNVGDGVGLSIIASGDVPVGGTVTQISAGDSHTCALLSTGNVRCWGRGANGRLGYGNTNNVGDGVGIAITAAGDVPIGGSVTQIATGGNHTCALLSTGNVRCWGSGTNGVLGHGNTNNVGDGVGLSIIASGNVPVGGTVTQIVAGAGQTCALLSAGNVRCWGFGGNGRLGYGNTNNVGDGVGLSIIASGDVPVGGTVTQISTGAGACALLSTGSMRCWGNGANGMLGYGNTNNVGDGVGPSIISAGDLNIF